MGLKEQSLALWGILPTTLEMEETYNLSSFKVLEYIGRSNLLGLSFTYSYSGLVPLGSSSQSSI